MSRQLEEATGRQENGQERTKREVEMEKTTEGQIKTRSMSDRERDGAGNREN